MPSSIHDAFAEFGKQMPYHKLPSFVDFIHRSLPARAGERICDVGAGRGRLWEHFPALRRQVTLVDGARVKDAAGIAGHVRRIVSPIEQLHGEAPFHYVVSTFGLDYVLDKDVAIVNIKKMMRPGAKLVLLLHHPGSTSVQRAQKVLEGLTALKEIFQEMQKGNFHPDLTRPADAVLKKLYPEWVPVSDQPLSYVFAFMRLADSMAEEGGHFNEEHFVFRTLAVARAYILRHHEGFHEGKEAIVAKDLAQKLEAIHKIEMADHPFSPEKPGIFRDSNHVREFLERHGFRVEPVEVLTHIDGNETIKAFAVVATKN